MNTMKCIYGKGEKCDKFNAEKECEICQHYIPVCKCRKEVKDEYWCSRYKIHLCNVTNGRLTICTVCGLNNPKNFDDLLEFFEDYTMKNLT